MTVAVRLEKVILDLDDRFSGPATRAAASAALLRREVDGINTAGRDADRSLSNASRSIDKTGTSSRRAGADIDRFSGRLRVIADAVAILGPGLVPIGAIGIPAVAGLAAEMGAAALATGTAILAFQGVGDTLKAVNDAAIEPSAENLEAARIALQNLSPEARSFVRELQAMRPAFLELRNSAAAGLFPGLVESLDDLERVLPQVERILFAVGNAAGDLAADAAGSLAGPHWAEFLRFIETDIPPALTALGRTVGNVAHGLSELWMAFDPLNDDVALWLLDASRGFDEWAEGLSKTEGFREFVAYIRDNGPHVAEAMGAIGNAVLQIVEAAAPLGGPVLQGLAAVANLVASIANSNAGPAIMATVTALALLRRGMSTFNAVSQTAWAQNISGINGYAAKVTEVRRTAIRGGAALAGLGVAASGAADGIGLTNTVSGALLGAMAGPWGAVIGGAAGLMIDFAGSNEETSAAVDEVTSTLNQQTGAITQNTREWARKALLDSGALDQASGLGLNLEQVTNAALGQGDAVRYVNEETSRLLQTAGPGGEGLALIGDVKDFRESLNSTAGTVNESRHDMGLLRQAAGQTAGGFRQAASAAQEFKEAVDRAFALLDKRAALRAAREAVRSFTDVLKNAPKDLRRGTAAYDEVEAALDEIARSSLTAAGHLKGMDKVEYLRGARADFIDAARKMGMTRSAAQQLANQLGLLGNMHPQPKITVQSNAEGIAAQTAAILSSISDEIVYIHTVRTGRGGQGAGYTPADGMTVPKTGLPYADRHPALLADGEEVISNRFGQADRHRELLKAINANRYADGGTVGGRYHSPQSTGRVVVERVVERLPGQVTLSIPGMGRLVADVADRRISDARTYSDRLDDRD